MTEKELEKLRKSRVIAALRRISRWWPPRAEAKRRSKVSPGKFKCENCGEVVSEKMIKQDHHLPVVDVKTGFIDWNTYIPRMLCASENFRNLCDFCHQTKTQIEAELRVKYRAIRKKATKKK